MNLIEKVDFDLFIDKSIKAIEKVEVQKDDFHLDIHHSIGKVLDLRIRPMRDLSYPSEILHIEF